MRLRYTKADGTQMEFELGERPVTIGRSPEADVVILDEKVSRIHCGIRYWDGDFYIKDLKSRNGTYVNDRRIDVAKLQPGDRIRVGSVVLVFEQEAPPRPEEALEEVEQELAQGKGYSTILREIVQSTDEGPGTAALRARDTSSGDEPAIRIKTRRRKQESEA
ncbi:MAG TPA: FHA domain-containing protein [Lentisphaerae bacterium]|nr:FHA domain-containing protein [Lentisphaerota bacterium]